MRFFGNRCQGAILELVSEPGSQPKGEGESGTVAYIAICSPRNFGGMNLIG